MVEVIICYRLATLNLSNPLARVYGPVCEFSTIHFMQLKIAIKLIVRNFFHILTMSSCQTDTRLVYILVKFPTEVTIDNKRLFF